MRIFRLHTFRIDTGVNKTPKRILGVSAFVANLLLLPLLAGLTACNAAFDGTKYAEDIQPEQFQVVKAGDKSAAQNKPVSGGKTAAKSDAKAPEIKTASAKPTQSVKTTASTPSRDDVKIVERKPSVRPKNAPPQSDRPFIDVGSVPERPKDLPNVGSANQFLADVQRPASNKNGIALTPSPPITQQYASGVAGYRPVPPNVRSSGGASQNAGGYGGYLPSPPSRYGQTQPTQPSYNGYGGGNAAPFDSPSVVVDPTVIQSSEGLQLDKFLGFAPERIAQNHGTTLTPDPSGQWSVREPMFKDGNPIILRPPTDGRLQVGDMQGWSIIDGSTISNVTGFMPLESIQSQAGDSGIAPLSEFSQNLLAGGELAAVIYYADGSATLSSEDRKAVERLAEQHKRGGGIFRIQGYASPPVSGGSSEKLTFSNYRYSLARAVSIAEGLIQNGVDPSSVYVVAYGDTGSPSIPSGVPTEMNGQRISEAQQARRAEIYLLR